MKTNNNKIRKGVSIIELLVVMLVFIIVAALGFRAIIEFRISTELSSAGSQFESIVRTVQNDARNNVVSRISPDSILNTVGSGDPSKIFKSQINAYLLYFNAGSLEIRSCKYDSGIAEYNCSNVEPISPTLDNIEFMVSPSSASQNCSGILYEFLTGELNVVSDLEPNTLANININTDMNMSQSCSIRVKHIKGGENKFIDFKFELIGAKFYRILS